MLLSLRVLLYSMCSIHAAVAQSIAIFNVFDSCCYRSGYCYIQCVRFMLLSLRVLLYSICSIHAAIAATRQHGNKDLQLRVNIDFVCWLARVV